jgi:ATP-dependent Clp protease protease subunit
MGSEENSQEHGESGTDGAMAERVIKNIHILDGTSNEEITILMNNIGGDPTHGLAIFDCIKSCKSPVKIIVYGHTMSMGSVILQAADERIMAPNASQMIHYGHLSVDKHAKTAYKIVDENKRLDRWMEELYLEKIREKNPKFKLSKLKKMCDHDTFLTAKESVELGLCDKVLGEDNE